MLSIIFRIIGMFGFLVLSIVFELIYKNTNAQLLYIAKYICLLLSFIFAFANIACEIYENYKKREKKEGNLGQGDCSAVSSEDE